jgi:hypothetical protein
MKKIKIKIIQKNGIKSSRYINKDNKKYYNYSRKTKTYNKKPKMEIKKIKYIILSKKKEKIITKKVKKEVTKRKEKLISEKIKEPIKEPEGYFINTYEFECKTSDIKLKHDFSIRDIIDDKILEMHENKYPDHELNKYTFLGKKFIAYGKGKAFDRDYTTEKQKDFLRILGVKEELIDSIKSKQQASLLISKKNKR